jgi:hypothetical protein
MKPIREKELVSLIKLLKTSLKIKDKHLRLKSQVKRKNYRIRKHQQWPNNVALKVILKR